MTLEELKKQWTDNFNNSKITIIDFSLNENYETTICFEHGNYTGGDFGYTPCLKSEKINLKKGDKFKTASIFIANDTSPQGVYRGVDIKSSHVTMKYKDKTFQIPMSIINIIDAKSISKSEAKSFVEDIIPNEAKIKNEESISKDSQTKNDSFLDKHKNHLLIAVALVAGYFAYKKFKK